ncbi:permease prefix domain 1-containing protein [Sphaerisporangium corydalis]|uniref:Permease prefix domain 1-containing protein n=1 Tax=Sphaerisporangium corydalis TaxID=1441875 RepID=A0ABV9EAS2_9ACTN|nr:permease prefix domain 1-containing protein [Sphaerisporangium corydalis]
MAGAGVIDDYVTELGRALRGPGRARHDLVTEARDSLADCADAYLADGVTRHEAERMAVAEFGTVGEIAPGYQEELAAHQGRRTAISVFLTVPLLTIIWWGVWRIFPDAPPEAKALRPAWFGPMAQFLDYFQFAMGVFGALALVGLSRGLRKLDRPKLLTRSLGIMVFIQVATIIGVSCALTAGGAAGLKGFDDYPPGMAACALSYLVVGWLLYSATRCLVASRGAPVAVPVAGRSLIG